MRTILKKGDRVRCKGRAEVGTISEVGMLITVEYRPRPDTLTLGLYSDDVLELVNPDEGTVAIKPLAARAALPEEDRPAKKSKIEG